jgi:hypothetical protein
LTSVQTSAIMEVQRAHENISPANSSSAVPEPNPRHHRREAACSAKDATPSRVHAGRVRWSERAVGDRLRRPSLSFWRRGLPPRSFPTPEEALRCGGIQLTSIEMTARKEMELENAWAGGMIINLCWSAEGEAG